jgi:nucleoside-diphosphate-sugar epimerase
MKILVTGAGGFVGTNLVRHLAPNHEVFALARRTQATPASVHWIEHDLTQPLEEASLPSSVDGVIHLAQSRHYKQFPERADDIFAVNVVGTFHLLEYARRAGATTFVFASTGGVYGARQEKLVETDPASPLDFYSTSKYIAELLVANYDLLFHTIVFRFFFVYGPGQKGMLIPNLLQKVRSGETVTIEGSGLRVNPIHVGDVVRLFEPALALERSELLNVSGDEEVDLAKLVQVMGDAVGKAPVIEHVAGPRDGSLVADNSRMKAVLGIEPRTSLAKGIASMLEP